MLAERGRRREALLAGGGELERVARRLVRPALRVLDLHDHAPVAHLRVLHGLVERVDGRDGDAGGAEPLHPRAARVCGDDDLERGVDAGAMRETLRPEREGGVAERLGGGARLALKRGGGVGHGVDEGAPVGVDGYGDEQPAVARAVGVVGDMQGQFVAGAGRRDAGHQVHHGVVVDERHLHVEHRDVDVLPLAGALALSKRGEDPERARHPRAEVAVEGAGAHWGAVGVAGHAHHAGVGLHGGVEGGAVASGAGESEPGDGAGDHAGVELAERGIVGAEPPGYAGAVVVDDDVGPADEVGEHLLAAAAAEVDDDAALVALQVHDVGRERAHHQGGTRAVELARVLAAGRLDLDDVGAEVAEYRRGERPGDDRGEVDDVETCERLHRVSGAAAGAG